MRTIRWLILLGIFAAGSARAAGDLVFVDRVIDNATTGDCKALADIDGDGLADAVVGGTYLYWYEAPDWTRRRIATAQQEFTTDMAVADMDGDGDVDLIVPDNLHGISWYENVDKGTSWVRHAVGPTTTYNHDVEVGDIDGDGDLDLASREAAWSAGDKFTIYRRDGADSWTVTSKATPNGEGLKLADVDGDGRLDVVVGGQWHRCPDGDFITGAWTAHVFDDTRVGDDVRVDVGDLDGDGDADIALTPSEAVGEIAWYAAPADPTYGSWTRHVLLTGADRYHTCVLVDLDGNGALDLLAAQMHVAANPRIAAWLNDGAGPAVYALIDDSSGHNLAVGDIDGDGDLDLLCADYIGNPPVRLCVNETLVSAVPTPAASVTVRVAPNPFNARLTVAVDNEGDGRVSVAVHDVRGRLVRRLAGDLPPGPHTLTWAADDVPSGTYLVVVAVDGVTVRAEKLCLVK